VGFVVVLVLVLGACVTGTTRVMFGVVDVVVAMVVVGDVDEDVGVDHDFHGKSSTWSVLV